MPKQRQVAIADNSLQLTGMVVAPTTEKLNSNKGEVCYLQLQKKKQKSLIEILKARERKKANTP